jgi:hypothetical protein
MLYGCRQRWLTDTGAPPEEEKNGQRDFEERDEKQNSNTSAASLATRPRD